MHSKNTSTFMHPSSIPGGELICFDRCGHCSLLHSSTLLYPKATDLLCAVWIKYQVSAHLRVLPVKNTRVHASIFEFNFILLYPGNRIISSPCVKPTSSIAVAYCFHCLAAVASGEKNVGLFLIYFFFCYSIASAWAQVIGTVVFIWVRKVIVYNTEAVLRVTPAVSGFCFFFYCSWFVKQTASGGADAADRRSFCA